MEVLSKMKDGILNSENIIVYGAGYYGDIVIDYLLKSGLCTKKKILVAVTKLQNVVYIHDLKVYEIHELKEYGTAFVIIAVSQEKQEEIMQVLTDMKFSNVFKMNELILYDMKQKILAENKFCRINERIDALQKEIQSCDDTIYWYDKGERNVVQENWGKVTEDVDFADKFLRLTKGLDGESVDTIIRILNRQKKFIDNNWEKLDLFTLSEQKQLKELNDNFFKQIFKISDELYAYRNYLLPCGHFEESVFYYKHGMEKIRNTEKLKGQNIFDIGGYIGDSIIILEELLPNIIYSCEAVPQNYDMLMKTVALNGLNNVIAECCALGSNKGIARINVAGSASSCNRKWLVTEETIEVPMITLDEYVEQNMIDNVGLIKVDIEGAEYDFLLGARKTIEKHKPVLLLSIYHSARDFFELKPMIENWNLGYKFTIYKSINGNITNETMLIAEVY